MPITGQNYIAGTISRQGIKTFTSVNPNTKQAGDIKFHNATSAEINQAVQQAVSAFAITKNYSATQLAELLDTVADEIEALGDELLETANWETGLGMPRLTGERGRTTGQLRAFGKLLREGSYVEAIIDTAQPNREPVPRPSIRHMLIPLGPVAVFSASNFPFAFAVAGGDTASAFAAGCPVIVKGHPSHPATSELFAQAINSATDKQGFPKGFFSLIQGNTIEVGQQLVQHPDIEAVGFTGSLRGGRAIFDTASQRPKPIPVYAEMGSTNPTVILPNAISARGEEIADGLVNSVTLGTGQFCTNPGVVFVVDNEQSQAFILSVTQKMLAKQPATLLNSAIERGLARTVNQTKTKASVEVLLGGEAITTSENFCYSHTVMQTTSSAFRDDIDLQEEHFGPVTLFVLCDSLNDLQATLHHLHGNLTSTIHAEQTDLETANTLYNLLQEKAGRLIWNGFPTGVEVVYSMHHGGPYPATTAPATTSVGMTAIKRFMRPVAFQNLPDVLLPDALKDTNPLNIWRIVDGDYTKEPIT